MDKGQYTITLEHERGLVRVRAVGEFNLKLGMALITDARQNAAAHRYNILCDVRESRAHVSLADWFYLPRRLGVYKSMQTRSVKTAIVVTPGRQEKAYRFFETVTSNVGLNIRVFLREEEALAWLGMLAKKSYGAG